MSTLLDHSMGSDRGSMTPELDPTLGADTPDIVAVPQRLGRYLMLDKLGEGGMGMVYAAYDTTLERKVAIKLLRHATMQARLQREAKALARLAHPHVVHIYEIAEHERVAYIVMELVNGSTLAAWLAARPRTRAEILAVFDAAGRGLAAAHEVGLTHRDFKPSNVMVGVDGRVVVMDFGLARDSDGATRLDDPLGHHDDSTALTRAGTLTGTPAYMAPEQYAGLDVDARTDQFSFCVALWEALHGRRPFAGENLPELASAVLDGRISSPATTEVPTWLRRVLERGLAREPEQRWPSMSALLDALHRDPTRRRRMLARAVLAGAVTLALAGGVASRQQLERERLSAAELATRAACVRAGQAIEADWNADVRARLEQVFVASGLPGVEQTWASSRERMSDYAARWTELRTEACLAAELEPRPDLLDAEQAAATLACLDAHRVAFQVLIDVWAEPEPQIIWRAPLAAGDLPALNSCAAATRPTTVGAELLELRTGLERIGALRLAGDYESAARLANEMLTHADASTAESARAELRLKLGLTSSDLGDYDDARVELHRSLLDALACGEDLVALRAAIALTHVVGRKLEQHQPGLDWARLGESLLDRTQLEGSLDHASLLVARALTYDAMGRYQDALDVLEQARNLRSTALGPAHPSVAAIIHDIGSVQGKLGEHETALASLRLALQLREAALGEAHPDVATSLHGLGTVMYAMGDYQAALETFRRVIAIREVSLGFEHPEVAAALSNAGSVEADLGDHQQSLITLARALAIYERSLGAQHPHLAYALHNIGISHMQLGQLDASLAAHQRALALREAALGSEHPLLAASLNSVGVVQVELGRLDDALGSHRRALAIRQAALGPDNPELGYSLANIAVVHEARGEHREALQEFERARELWARTLGPTHPVLGQVLHSIGKQQEALGDHSSARVSFEAALRIRETVPGAPSALADTRFALAQLLSRAGEGERARSLALAAAEDYRAAGEEAGRAAVEAWLDR